MIYYLQPFGKQFRRITPMKKITGNMVSSNEYFFGELTIENNIITRVRKISAPETDADITLPGFIDTHLHGLGEYSAESPEGIRGMAAFAPVCGTTAIVPTFASEPEKFYTEMLAAVRDMVRTPPPGARIPGCHMEGPFLSHRFKGGMVEEKLRLPSVELMEKFLDIAQGTLKIVTIAPELPGAKEVIELLCRNRVVVSAGHTDCPPELVPETISWGISRVCHLFDAWDSPETKGGVRQAAVTDLALTDDNVMKELIVDGLHVPPELIRLARRAAGAEKIIAVSDAMQGAGLKSGRFHDCGEWFIIRDGDVARRERDNAIVGSSLSMNRAFYNMITRFGFTIPEASVSLSGNPARSVGLGEVTGSIAPGFEADLTCLAPDMLTVKRCFVRGEELYRS